MSVIGSGGKSAVFLLWRESFITTGKKDTVVCLAGCAVVSVFGSGDYDWKKKFQSSVWRVVLLSLLQPENKDTSLLQPEKKILSCISST